MNCIIECTLKRCEGQLLPGMSCAQTAACEVHSCIDMRALLSRAAAHQRQDMMTDGPCKILEV